MTALGTVLLAQMDRVPAEVHGLLEVARGAAQLLNQTFRLRVIQRLGLYYLPFLLRQVRTACPHLALCLAEGQTRGGRRLFVAGRIEPGRAADDG